MTCTSTTAQPDAAQPQLPAPAPGRSFQFRAAVARLARRPAARLTLITACIVAGFTPAAPPVVLLAGLLLLLAEAAAWRIRAARRLAAQLHQAIQADPGDPDEAARICGQLLDQLRPGPEQVIATTPAGTPVRWDIQDRHDRDGRALNLPAARADKMQMIRHLLRQAATRDRLLHRLPQLLLVASDGAVIELFGDRTGTLAPPPGGLASPPHDVAAWSPRPQGDPA